MNIKGATEYEITIGESSYEIKFTQSVDNELSGLMIARELLKDAKVTLTSNLKEAKGKTKSLVKDRLSKVTAGEYAVGKLIESILQIKISEHELSVLHRPKE